jgi:restriction endonuclease S subunit
MNNKFVKQQLDENSTGSVLQQLSIDKLNDILVPVPDIQTQMVIIESVTDAQNKLIEAEQQVLTAELALKAEQTNLQNIINSSWGEGENG